MYKPKHLFLCIIASTTVALSTPIHADSTASSFVSKVKNLSGIEMAAIAASAIGVGILGKIVYSFLFGLSDLQEIEYALTLLETAQGTHNEIASHYYTPCTIFRNLELNNHNTTKQDDNALKLLIEHSGMRRPYYTYVTQLDETCARIKKCINQIAQCKVHLFERKIAVIKEFKKYDELTKKDIIQQYNTVIARCANLQDTLSSLQNTLSKIRNYVIHLHEYENEYAAARIEALENEIRQLKLSSWPHHCTQTHFYVTQKQLPCTDENQCSKTVAERPADQAKDQPHAITHSFEKDREEAYKNHLYLSTL